MDQDILQWPATLQHVLGCLERKPFQPVHQTRFDDGMIRYEPLHSPIPTLQGTAELTRGQKKELDDLYAATTGGDPRMLSFVYPRTGQRVYAQFMRAPVVSSTSTKGRHEHDELSSAGRFGGLLRIRKGVDFSDGHALDAMVGIAELLGHGVGRLVIEEPGDGTGIVLAAEDAGLAAVPESNDRELLDQLLDKTLGIFRHRFLL